MKATLSQSGVSSTIKVKGVGTMPGEELTTESIYVVCTKDIVTLADNLPRIGTSMPASGDSKSFIKLQRWLTNIPLDRRVEKNLVYHVAK